MEKLERNIQSLRDERDFYKRAYEELLQRLSTGEFNLKTQAVHNALPVTDKTETNVIVELKALTVKRLLILSAFFLYGAKIDELSKVFDVSENSIRVNLFRAREALGMNNGAQRVLEVTEGLKQYDNEVIVEFNIFQFFSISSIDLYLFSGAISVHFLLIFTSLSTILCSSNVRLVPVYTISSPETSLTVLA